jgi:hypothetical protein
MAVERDTGLIPLRLDPKLYVAPRFIVEGQGVYVRRRHGGFLLCEVVAAMGDTARVVNLTYGLDTWFRLDDLLVPREGRALRAPMEP